MHNIACAKQINTYSENVFSDIMCSKYIFYNSTYGYSKIESKQYLFEYDNGELYRYYVKDGELKKEKTLYVHLQKRKMDVDTDNYNSYMIVPNSFKKHFKMDINTFNDIIRQCNNRKDEYEHNIKEKLKLDSKRRNKELCWWILRLIRIRIRLFGGVDLDGK